MGEKRPRRDCEVCGRTQVAIQTNGRLYWHKWPGLGMWAEFGDCDGIAREGWNPSKIAYLVAMGKRGAFDDR